MTSHTVSIIIPCYNVEKYLPQCLLSIYQQTFKDFEVIAVNDGSTDGTLDILKKYVGKRFRVIDKKNGGIAAARNAGIEVANGMFIALLNAGDFWHPEKLARHVEHLQQNGHIGVSYSGSIMVDDNGRPLGIKQSPRCYDVRPAHILCRNPVGNGSSAVIRKEVFELIRFNPELRNSEDIDCWLRIALQTNWKFEGVKAYLTYYRANRQGIYANLAKQYTSWLYVMHSLQRHHPRFISRYYSLAKAYQLRYLARRAIRNEQPTEAVLLIGQAIAADSYIIFQEPVKTLVTATCALLQWALPQRTYQQLERYTLNTLTATRN